MMKKRSLIALLSIVASASVLFSIMPVNASEITSDVEISEEATLEETTVGEVSTEETVIEESNEATDVDTKKEDVVEVEDVEDIDEAVEIADDISQEDIEVLEDACAISEDTSVLTETLLDGMNTYTTACSVANFAGLGYTNNEQGPISIVKAVLKDGNGNTSDVYLIGLSGTAFVKNQATGIVSDILAGFSINNPYLSATKSAISENIPEGSKLILCGHSLGGMVAQQVAADKSMKKNYEIINTVTFGAPLTSSIGREGTVKRLGDKYDMIPYLSANGAVMPIRSIGGLNREDGGYGSITNFWSAHMGSYCRTDVWGNYDVLGFKSGNATLTYDVSEVSYYKAPTKW